MEIGFIGLGAMGEGMVPRLLAAGHTVTGWNRTREKAEPLIEQGMRWARCGRWRASFGAARSNSVTSGCVSCTVDRYRDPGIE